MSGHLHQDLGREIELQSPALQLARQKIGEAKSFFTRHFNANGAEIQVESTMEREEGAFTLQGVVY
jgi:hypothetical protein